MRYPNHSVRPSLPSTSSNSVLQVLCCSRHARDEAHINAVHFCGKLQAIVAQHTREAFAIVHKPSGMAMLHKLACV